jgi:hypothetical protein
MSNLSWPKPFFQLSLEMLTLSLNLTANSPVSRSSGLVWRYQIPLCPLIQIMRQTFFFALIFWPPFKASIPFNQQTTPLSSWWSSKQSSKLSTMTSLTLTLSCNTRRTTILQGQETGQWLSVLPLPTNGTELSATEFPDALLLRYTRCPLDLPLHCNGCLQKFSIGHALECKTGGLIIS